MSEVDLTSSPVVRRDSVPAASPRKLRTFLAIDEQPRLVDMAQTNWGRGFLTFLFSSLLVIVKVDPWVALLAMGAATCAYLPKYRALVLTGTTLGALALSPFWFSIQPLAANMLREKVVSIKPEVVRFASLVCVFLAAGALLEFARARKNSYLARRPIISLLMIIAALTTLANSHVLVGISQVCLWGFLTSFIAYLWFIAYALVDQRSRDRSSTLFQFGTFHPFWGGTSTPFGKGAAYLRKTTAKTRAELAVTQIKGLKLLVWAFALKEVSARLTGLVESIGITPLIDLQAQHANSVQFAILDGWSALIWDTTSSVLSLAVYGHIVIAIARFAGFRLPRNMYRPLEARTLADYWNRYYFYFKELLVEFFFIPTFLKHFRNTPKLRIFFATFMSAGVGNFIYHFVRDLPSTINLGFLEAILSFQNYVFYCLVLSIGIGFSQLRTMGRKLNSSLPHRIFAFVCVWGFVVSIHIFGVDSRQFSLAQRLSFMASLLGFN